MVHIPVLLQEVMDFLNVKKGGKYIDATYGVGGHSEAIEKLGAVVLGIDRDSSVKSKIKNQNSKVIVGNFKDIKEIAESEGFAPADGILFDFGLGSHQLDDPVRGFSFQRDGPLDMRYNPSQPKSASDIVNHGSEKDLLKIFYEYGEEKRFGKKIARAILDIRKTAEIKTTTQLFEIIKQSLPGKFRHRAGDTARRIFQALRIEVNGELAEIEKALPQALGLLVPGGRMAAISFHSLEDRIVKHFFQEAASDCVCPPGVPVCGCGKEPEVKILTKKPVTASSEEIKTNRRSQSAKLRAAEKL